MYINKYNPDEIDWWKLINYLIKYLVKKTKEYEIKRIKKIIQEFKKEIRTIYWEMIMIWPKLSIELISKFSNINTILNEPIWTINFREKK